ncbi:hypothetical protein SDC9_132532 [bioreactor metagenome]|uniref:Uncharacterized protein n=1 Tax=bioreactor metagenome TaxID=1076179 RepID=A0A645D864_9ZZZZ
MHVAAAYRAGLHLDEHLAGARCGGGHIEIVELVVFGEHQCFHACASCDDVDAGRPSCGSSSIDGIHSCVARSGAEAGCHRFVHRGVCRCSCCRALDDERIRGWARPWPRPGRRPVACGGQRWATSNSAIVTAVEPSRSATCLRQEKPSASTTASGPAARIAGSRSCSATLTETS